MFPERESQVVSPTSRASSLERGSKHARCGRVQSNHHIWRWCRHVIRGMLLALVFDRMLEIILQSQSLLTHTLTNARNEKSITPVLLKEYNDALEKLETVLYPDITKRFLVQSHRNLISIMKQKSKYFELIELINSGCEVNTSSDSGNSSPNPFDSGNTTRTLLNNRPQTLLVIFLK